MGAAIVIAGVLAIPLTLTPEARGMNTIEQPKTRIKKTMYFIKRLIYVTTDEHFLKAPLKTIVEQTKSEVLLSCIQLRAPRLRAQQVKRICQRHLETTSTTAGDVLITLCEFTFVSA